MEALRCLYCSANPFSTDTNPDSFTVQALLTSVMNKILASALQREKVGTRNPPDGESWNKAKPARRGDNKQMHHLYCGLIDMS